MFQRFLGSSMNEVTSLVFKTSTREKSTFDHITSLILAIKLENQATNARGPIKTLPIHKTESIRSVIIDNFFKKRTNISKVLESSVNEVTSLVFKPRKKFILTI